MAASTAPPMRRRSSGFVLGEVSAETATPAEPSVATDANNEDLNGAGMGAIPSFDMFPEYLRLGPWSPLAYVYLVCFTSWLFWVAGDALKTYPSSSSSIEREYSAVWNCIAVYCVGLNVWILRQHGPVPYVSFTIVGYAFLTVRLAASALGLWFIAESLRLPTLVMAWTTTTVWWFLLTPMFLMLIKDEKGRRGFVKFNFSFFLLNVHLFNLPLAMLDHRSSWRPLTFFDMWFAYVTALLYLLFYLLVLDPMGWHFYIFLSPRRAWCCYPGYTLVLCIYYAVYRCFG
eukprot:gnl/TRDRNA2_/TRDRNA2_94083_c0_seq1.p1 gnl/TRDRNA2_/TRDRNA2_94083_c0~~gnl/TRDRNA2_/TRDRNA2_94083_c0_seq1.p1  ORF type:complete len:287 (-),score=23.22 gnl/TRDRNA2_/TRDRNA2_94083_c0_seq1:192-1052(-)